MAGKSPASPELIAEWTDVLHEACRELEAAEDQLVQAKEKFRATINAAFDAGLSVNPISQAINLTPSRTYQLRAGRRT
jgi:hypothetical protein